MLQVKAENDTQLRKSAHYSTYHEVRHPDAENRRSQTSTAGKKHLYRQGWSPHTLTLVDVTFRHAERPK